MQTAPRLPCMRPQRVGQYSRRISERCFTHPRSDCDEDRVRNPWVCGARGAHQPELLVAGDSAFANPPRRNPFRPQFFQDAILSRRRKSQSFQNSIPPDRNPSAMRCLRNSHSLRNAIPPCLCRSTCGVLVSSCTFYSVASRHFTVTTTTSSLGRSKRGTSGFVRRIGTTSRGMPRILSPGSSRLTGKGG